MPTSVIAPVLLARLAAPNRTEFIVGLFGMLIVPFMLAGKVGSLVMPPPPPGPTEDANGVAEVKSATA